MRLAAVAALLLVTLAGCGDPPEPTAGDDEGDAQDTTSSDPGAEDTRTGDTTGGGGGADECTHGCPATGDVAVTVHVTASADYEAAFPLPNFGACFEEDVWKDAALAAG